MYSQGREPLGDSRKDNSPWATCSPLEELAGPLVGVCPRDTLARAPQESCSAMLTASSIRKRENWRRPKHPRTSSGHRNCWIRTMGRSTAVTSGEPLASTRKQHHVGQTKRAAVRGSKEESAVPPLSRRLASRSPPAHTATRLTQALLPGSLSAPRSYNFVHPEAGKAAGPWSKQGHAVVGVCLRFTVNVGREDRGAET